MVARVGGGSSPQDWFYGLPPITRCYFSAVLLLTATTSFGLVSAPQLHLDFTSLWQRFEIWRLATSFCFFGPFSFPFLIQLYMLVQYSERYEVSPFNTGGGGTPADYAWMLGFGAVFMSCAAYLFQLPFLGSAMVFMILYTWSRKNPDSPASMFGFQLQAFYLPWALVGFHLLIGNSIFMPLLGIGVGHLYYFLVEIAPAQANFEVIKTPGFFIDYFGGPASGASGAAVGQAPRGAAGAPPPRAQGGYTWGSGRVLGAN